MGPMNTAARDPGAEQSLTDHVMERLSYIAETLRDVNARLSVTKDKTFGCYPTAEGQNANAKLSPAPNGKAEEINTALSEVLGLAHQAQSHASDLQSKI